MKHLYHARKIRNNIIDSFEKAAIPGTTLEERERLLSFVVVGGGPTSCEFVAELHDFATNDVKRLFPELIEHVKVSLGKCTIECRQILIPNIKCYVLSI